MTGAIGDHPKWNQSEFKAFLLLYAAMVDMEFAVEEKLYIINKANSESLATVQAEFEVLSDFERLNIIGIYQQEFFDTAPKREILFLELKELFESDGHYSNVEQNLMSMLKRLL